MNITKNKHSKIILKDVVFNLRLPSEHLYYEIYLFYVPFSRQEKSATPKENLYPSSHLDVSFIPTTVLFDAIFL